MSNVVTLIDGEHPPPEQPLPERLQWTLTWQTENLMPELVRPGADVRLREYWCSARRMNDVLGRVALTERSLSVDIGGGLTTPLRWLPGRRLCIDPLAGHYAARFALPLDDVGFIAGEGESIALEDQSVDLAICTNCIDHTDAPHAVIQEIKRVLRPGGWFWFTCEESRSNRQRNHGHPHALDRLAIRNLVAGFAVVLEWEEPWRGVFRYLLDEEPFAAMELGFLLRTSCDRRARDGTQGPR